MRIDSEQLAQHLKHGVRPLYTVHGEETLLALEAGDLIPLTVAPGDPIVLRIEGEPCGRARFGERDGRLAVRLTEILRPASNR